MNRVLVAIVNFVAWTMVPKIYKAAVRLLPNSPHEAALLELILPPTLLMMRQTFGIFFKNLSSQLARLDEEAILVDFRGFTNVKEVGMLVARGIEILAARKV
jgi:hypothetical protein